jgi:HEAT repeat protein
MGPNRVVAATALLLAFLLLADRSFPAPEDAITADEKLLQGAKIGTSPSEIVAYLRSQVITDADRKRIQTLITQLGSNKFDLRNDAQVKLEAIGWPAISFLKNAAQSTDLEVRNRAEKSLATLMTGPGPYLSGAAVRLLVHFQPPEALPLLLAYVRDVPDESVEEEVLTGLRTLGVRAGKIDPLLLQAVSDPQPERRAAAACVLGRAGGGAQRGVVRQLLADKDQRVRRAAANGLLGSRFPRSADDTGIPDDELLMQNARLGTDAPALLEFFRKRTLREADVQQINRLVAQLGSDRFKEREDATRQLIEFGAGALELLRQAMRSTDQEVVRRAEVCIEKITNYPGPALPLAALRLLARRPAPEAVGVLLQYLPFVDDGDRGRVEEEALATLCALSVREPRLDPALMAALQDSHPARRAAAALVLGRVGDRDQVQAVHPLLKDGEARVRFRAAQGLLAARDRAAVETLVALLADGPVEHANEAELVLRDIAGERAPQVSMGDGTAEVRRKCQDAWLAWWRDHGSRQELPVLDLAGRQLGLTLVSELIGNNANGNRVWEFGLDGKPRWELTNLQGPIDAHILPGNRVLIAEHNAQVVTERDLKGEVRWQHKVPGNPVACQRLPNGNTFIATYNAVMEVKPTGDVVYQHNPNAGVGGVIYDACKLANGNIVCIGGRGTVVELKSTGEKVNTIQVGNNGGWGGVTPLPSGRFLVAMMNPGRVAEVDREGKVHWEANVPNACHAIRLPNGNTLVACMNIQKVVEINRAGATVWEKATTGRPFHVSRR